MKEIQEIIFPLNLGTAKYIDCNGKDNYLNEVVIYYQLLTDEFNCLQSGILVLNGFDYESYNISNDGNKFIYDWSCNQLNIILI